MGKGRSCFRTYVQKVKKSFVSCDLDILRREKERIPLNRCNSRIFQTLCVKYPGEISQKKFLSPLTNLSLKVEEVDRVVNPFKSIEGLFSLID